MKQPKEPSQTDVFRKIDSIIDKANTANPQQFQLPSAQEIVQELITEFPVLNQYFTDSLK